MELKINVRDVRWWFWAVTLAFIVAAVAGWTPGYGFAMTISAAHVAYFLARETDPRALPTQVGVAYFALTRFGLWLPGRWFVYVLLGLGTVTVTFFDRCAIALMPKQMPWNRGHDLPLG